MKTDNIIQLANFVKMFYYGFALGFIYDFIKSLFFAKNHTKLSDIFFAAISMALILYALFLTDYLNLKYYYIFSLGLGYLVYYFLFSAYIKKMLKKTNDSVSRIILILLGKIKYFFFFLITPLINFLMFVISRLKIFKKNTKKVILMYNKMVKKEKEVENEKNCNQ